MIEFAERLCYTEKMNDIIYTWVTDRAPLEEISNNPKYEWPHNFEYFEELIHLKRALVAHAEGRPVGYLLFQVLWGNTPFLSQIWIDESQQGKGVGKQMVSMLEERLKNEKYDTLTTSNEVSNGAGVGFVSKIGFKTIGTLEMDHGPEVFSLKKL